jgi:serine/threonine protein kinase
MWLPQNSDETDQPAGPALTEDLLAGRYRRLGPLGRGAMGEVWLADDLVLGRRVAIKRLHLDPASGVVQEAIDRMTREARTAARLHHANIVMVYDLIQDEGAPHVIMEYVEGQTLADVLKTSTAMDVATAMRIAVQIAAALAAAHRSGIVHRDVKPANILLTPEGSAKLVDFGIARAAGDPSLTQTGLMVGTPSYLAPEVARGGRASPASDVWSLAATMFSAVEGRPPFGAPGDNPLAVLSQVVSDPVPTPQRAGPMTAALMAGLQRDPHRRPSAQQFASMIQDDAEPTRVRLPAPPAPVTRRVYHEPQTSRIERPRLRRRGRPLAALAVAAGLLIIGGAIAAIVASRSHSAGTPAAVSTSSAGRSGAASSTSQSTAPSSGTQTRASGPMTAANMRNAVTSYYALIPADLHSAWSRLGPALQAQGYRSYSDWWTQFDAVHVRVISTDPAHHTATIALSARRASDGRVVGDSEQLDLITAPNGRGLLINRSRVV